MQIMNDIVQGSDEWLRVRLGLVTASKLHNMITPKKEEISDAKIQTYAKVLSVEVGYNDLDSDFKSAAMQDGNDKEPDVRQLYQEEAFTLVEQVGFIMSDCGNYGYSPDGLVGDDGLIEIKCQKANKHCEFLINKREIPFEYKCQMQGGMFITGRKWCDYVVYNDQIKDKSKQLIIKRVFRDEEFIKKLEAGIQKVIETRDSYLKKIAGGGDE